VDSNDSVNLPPEPPAPPIMDPRSWEAPARPIQSPFPDRLPSGNTPQLLDQARHLGWNWGGFLMPYLWLIGHGRLTLGFLLLLSACVPFFGLAHLVFYPAAAIYLGLNGYELAWREQPYHSIGQLEERERAWMLWGAALFIVLFVILLLALVYLRFLAGLVDNFIQDF
jgi:hypothetical protein